MTNKAGGSDSPDSPVSGPGHAPDTGAGAVGGDLNSSSEVGHWQPESHKVFGGREELLKALHLRTRRVNQLLGERDQLERQLSRAEKALQQLSRELGAAKAPTRAAPAARLWPPMCTLFNQLRASLGRLRPGRYPRPHGSTVASVGAASGHGAARLVPFAEDGKQRPVMAVAACGLAPEERARVLEVVARYSAHGDVVPLVLTDDDDFAPLRSRALLFEYLPSASVRERFAPALEWELYLQRRLALIRRKWRPVRVIAFGRASVDLVHLWAESPFEDPALGRLPAQVAGRPPPALNAGGPPQEA